MSLYVNSYPIDLGNGFVKRIVNDTCVVEPSILAEAATYFGDDTDSIKIQLEADNPFFVGNDVVAIGLKPESALGEYDIARYETPEFKKLFFGFIAKDFKQDVTIKRLVTGLPVQHFKAKVKVLEELLKGSTVVKVNGEDITINVEEVSVIPQPIGTYLHLVAKKSVTPNKDTTLIVDCGHGTLDVTELKGKTIVKRAGNNDGAKEAYINIYNELSGEYGSISSFTIPNIPTILHEGVLVGGSYKSIRTLPEVQRILRDHFNSIFTFLRENKFDLRSYNKVVFTGGVVHLYKDFFNERKETNFIILEEGQTANARGYHEFGKALTAK